MLEPAALDFAVTLKNVSATSKVLVLSMSTLDEARHLSGKLRLFLGDQQASVDYAPLYLGLLDSYTVLASRFPQLRPDFQFVRHLCASLLLMHHPSC